MQPTRPHGGYRPTDDSRDERNQATGNFKPEHSGDDRWEIRFWLEVQLSIGLTSAELRIDAIWLLLGLGKEGQPRIMKTRGTGSVSSLSLQ